MTTTRSPSTKKTAAKKTATKKTAAKKTATKKTAAKTTAAKTTAAKTTAAKKTAAKKAAAKKTAAKKAAAKKAAAKKAAAKKAASIAATHARPDRGAAVASTHGIQRSSHWSAVRNAFIHHYPECVACGALGEASKHAEVHHIIPFHFCVGLGRPDLELDFRNLITLCEHPERDHHLLIGHLNHFKSSNPDVRPDAAQHYLGWTHSQIVVDERWIQRTKGRPPEWVSMTEADKQALRKLIDDLFPRL